MEIVPGVHRIRAPFLKNIYLILDGGPILVDTGLPGNCSRVVECLRHVCLFGESLKAVVLTHSHIDHMGSAGRIAAATGAEIWAHRLDAPRIEGGVPAGGYGSFLEALTDSLTRLGKAHVDRRLDEGDTIDCLGGLNVIHTPGHTEGSICLYQAEKGVLFSGDTIQYSWGRIRKPMRVFCQDSGKVDDSIERIAGLDFEYMFSGEGMPVLGGASDKLRAFLKKKTVNC
ncbi:MAG: MBL fold metallo-hydrolase [bacterium]